MHKLICVFVAGIAIATSAVPAYAQDESKFGVVVAYPASVGLEWQAAPKVAIRFDADYRQLSTEGTSEFDFDFVPDMSLTTKIESRDLEFGVSLLFDLHRSDDLRLYLAPRIGVLFSNSSLETEFNGDPALLAFLTFPADSDSSSAAPTGGVALGASHDVSARFRVFGEAGFNYTRGTIGGLIGDDVTSTAFGLRAGVGALIRF